MSQEMAEVYAEAMRHLALKARGVVRDLNPKGEMKYMRIRAKRHEVLVAFGESVKICEKKLHTYNGYVLISEISGQIRQSTTALSANRDATVGCRYPLNRGRFRFSGYLTARTKSWPKPWLFRPNVCRTRVHVKV